MSRGEELDDVLSKLDPDACLSFFSGMPEKDRKNYVERCQLWLQLAIAYQETGSWISAMSRFSITDLPKRSQEQIALINKVKSGEIKISAKVQERECLPVVRLALTACAGLSDLRRLPLPAPTQKAFEIMRARNPKWFDRWLDMACRKSPHESFELCRSIEKAGIAIAERADGYYLAMALTLGRKEAADLLSYLQSDSDIFPEQLYAMLENDAAVRAITDPAAINEELSRRQNFLTQDWTVFSKRLEESRRASYIWGLVIPELVLSGYLQEEKILDLIFNWLTRLSTDTESKSSNSYIAKLTPAGWFQNLHNELKLSCNKKGLCAGKYTALLSVKDSSTLAFAVQHLNSCPPETLPLDDLLINLPRVFYHKKKDAALAAFKLIEKLQSESDAGNLNRRLQDNECQLLLLEALEHSSSEIHKKALSCFKKSKAFENQEFKELLAARLDRTSGLVKKEFIEALEQNESKDTAPGAVEKGTDARTGVGSGRVEGGWAGNGRVESSSVAMIDNRCAEIKERISLLDPELCRIAEIESAVASCEAGERIKAISSSDLLAIPRLDPKKKIQKVENLDDLIFLYLHILEGQASVDDLERLLDGLSSFCDLRPPDFDKMVSSLRKKLEPAMELFKQIPPAIFPFTGISPLVDLQALAAGWLDSSEKPRAGLLNQALNLLGVKYSAGSYLPSFLDEAVSTLRNSAPPLIFFSERVRSLLVRVSKRQALPLLAAPTHEGGFIDPRVLTGRLLLWQNANEKLDRADLIQCMLRLAPECRKEALADLPAGNDEPMRALKYALGDEMKGPFNMPEFWVAAFRSRHPGEESPFLFERFPELGPGSAFNAKYSENFDAYRKRPESIYGTVFQKEQSLLPLQPLPPVKYRPNLKFFPCELLNDNNGFWDGNDYLEYYYLLDRESYFAYLARRMALYLESQGNYWKSSWNSLFDPAVSLCGMGSWVLIFGLSAKQPETSRLALDATIAAIEEERLEATLMGARMANAFGTEKMTLSRWINSFKEIARISELHLDFVASCFQAFIAGLPVELAEKPPVAALELLYDSCVSAKYAIENSRARNFLEKVKGKGKAAKLSKLLLELKTGEQGENLKAASCQILESRLQKVERWQSWLEPKVF